MRIEPKKVEAYLRKQLFPDAVVTALAPLGQSHRGDLKAHGYGRPVRITFTSQGRAHEAVLRTMAPDPFGHDRRSDRAAVLFLAYDSFNKIPRHVRALDAGTFDEDGVPVSAPGGEPFLLTSYADGRLYAEDLMSLGKAEHPQKLDIERAHALADYLAELHRAHFEPAHYVRSIRDTVGHGEGLLGLIDGYSKHDEIATPERLEAIEIETIRWRWKLRDHADRSCRTHGDFHPFNILFREKTDFSVLDASRGGAGEPADDVVALAVNYLFFALTARDKFEGALRELWWEFWSRYLEESGDLEITEFVAPFFAWRLLVLVSPVWYPSVPPALRDRLLAFAERLLRGARFDPKTVDQLLRV
jgi:hypothetical protein